MIVDRHRQVLLGILLADHVLIEVLFDFARLGGFLDTRLLRTRLTPVLFDDVVAEFHALGADENILRTLNERVRLIAGPTAETAYSTRFPIACLFCHAVILIA